MALTHQNRSKWRIRGVTIEKKNKGSIVYVDGRRLKKPVVGIKFIHDPFYPVGATRSLCKLIAQHFPRLAEIEFADGDYEYERIADFSICGKVIYINTEFKCDTNESSSPEYDPRYEELYQKLRHNRYWFDEDELGGYSFYFDGHYDYIDVYKDGRYVDWFNFTGYQSDYEKLKEFLDKPELRKLKERIEQDTNNYLEE